ncbi:MAG: hypothetical protein A2268_15330 [Candidatus Raymondbacteria bacterium RifOxyA12_full_50_37]|uniref:Nucleotidyltransferase n=1 Tax=Candidatus Raymondbacteria bacterium RIFOXYD12_FULL_49_13 TaxID=1817890 RepID=A0A1F7F6R1_UNCRA|nr:MAG: hypothetical protein A2268_15330 [Candidatus Raymondbacteria bacterium RifOxyA12_full_50_37]OGJ88475.1 MAG: hypothetical protein A2248_19935 [Candidatus Raymondbacteria bacterium RIFOXYA2_FULL_49_16]OGJ90642.1 MAG: hypothetical protein A2350_18580 [Candidatus Raymondbacteria bacterium RifOxyB12_full_50_8]OGJ98935.1 MAG: hypothetical protein A2453_10650 [Candidatus Raymondbacteria bacterium RIFOXYC2_FULL_50_21]OGK02365.1 MAG: hypothetical protein A2519_15965 [Candidatus Raymondbacteria b
MMEEVVALKECIGRLNKISVPYMLTGSFALNYYAVPRMTRDIDIVIMLPRTKANDIVAAFEGEFYISEDAVRQALDRNSMFNIIHNDTLLKIDMIIQKNSPFHQQAFQRRQKGDIDNCEVWISSKEDLILAKMLWARDTFSDMQMADIRNIMFTGYDAAYVDSWAAELGLAGLLEKCRCG